jgi:hypothetical protein
MRLSSIFHTLSHGIETTSPCLVPEVKRIGNSAENMERSSDEVPPALGLTGLEEMVSEIVDDTQSWPKECRRLDIRGG